MKDRIKKAAAIMGQVWEIGKRRFGGDWAKKLWLFDKLIWSVMGYGVEIWGWVQRRNMEKLQEKYLRWMLRRTPGYLVRAELQRKKLRVRAGMRVWGFEKRLEEERGSELARKCWREVKKKVEGRKWDRGGKKRKESFSGIDE